MAKFTQYLSLQNIRQGVLCSSKKRTLELVGDMVAQQFGIDEKICFEHLFSREKMGCTGIGAGIALPHAKLPKGNEPIAVFLQLATPIDYSAPDRREVDLVYALLIPEHSCTKCSAILPDLARKFTDKTFCKQLRMAQSAEEIWEIFTLFDHHMEMIEQQHEQENADEIKTH